ncbi:MAG: DUF502 domain-containing protein [Planctomycetota bacterium]
MGDTQPHTFMGDFRKFFGRGLAILLPSVLTLWLLFQAFMFVFNNVAAPINSGIRSTILWVTPRVVAEDRLPSWFRVTEADLAQYRLSLRDNELLPIDETPDAMRAEVRRLKFKRVWGNNWYLEGAGLVAAIVLIYLAGLLLGNFLGRRIYSRVEGLIAQIPGFKQVYPHVKQVVDLIMGEQKMAFSRVVLVEYPRHGLWTVGLVTSNSLPSIASAAGGPVLSVFIPTSPTPFTGFTINVRTEDVVDLPVPIDEAIRFVITAGVLAGREGEPPSPTVVDPSGSAPVERAAASALADRERE